MGVACLLVAPYSAWFLHMIHSGLRMVSTRVSLATCMVLHGFCQITRAWCLVAQEESRWALVLLQFRPTDILEDSDTLLPSLNVLVVIYLSVAQLRKEGLWKKCGWLSHDVNKRLTLSSYGKGDRTASFRCMHRLRCSSSAGRRCMQRGLGAVNEGRVMRAEDS